MGRSGFSIPSLQIRLFQMALIGLLALAGSGCTMKKLYKASHIQVFMEDVEEVVVAKNGAVAYKCDLLVKRGENEPEIRGRRYLIANPDAMKRLVEMHTVTPGQTDMAPGVVVITKETGPNWRMLPTGLGEKDAEPEDLPKDIFDKGVRYKPRAKGGPIEFPYNNGESQMNVVVDDTSFELRPLTRQAWWYRQLILPAFAVDVVTYPIQLARR